MKEKTKKPDSGIMGAGVFGVFFIGMGIKDLVAKQNGFWIDFLIGALGFIFLIYKLKKTKNNHNERYEDERKKFVSEKSKSMSFDILFLILAISQILISYGKIEINSYPVISIIIIFALIIQLTSYLVCKSKY
ncbi:DUF2178 domain-containing protein [Clostridium estertheticum]|uniref:DUF2178 domain-containing protein n=1 Tax=Clostridium estertheticum TaxID=238834 RepID=UPI001C7D9F5B|nr:DUF2178 domain-containing protein [Clostridium estertheticum]MBX4261565.1 DUF2178 domain-containing protein [Clostridium estertheticum]MCB2339069.1 DUF2178 domain-containing protein [Clostridium estertheticum]WLC70935.1 DUF2178 domain-containing protein [Clostridium estertheticum]